jgi:cytosine/adenosine deaminase-related metal-dependent hydrolase
MNAKDPDDDAPPKCLRARWLFSGSDSPVPDAELTLERECITAIRRASSRHPSHDIPHVAFVPAFYNAHTHLEFSDLPAPLPAREARFVDWLRQVLQWRTTRDADGTPTKPQAIATGVSELLNTGTFAAGEIATNWDHTLDQLPTPLEGVCFHEWISLNPERTQQLLQQAHATHAEYSAHPGRWRFGISPHAPYTASWELVQSAVQLAQLWNAPLAMHLAESHEELELLASHSGDLWCLLQERGVWNPAAIPRGIAVHDYLKVLCQAPRALIIHGNLLDSRDYQLLAQHADHVTLVHCPRTHHHFRRGTFPLAELSAMGVSLSLGTDSRSSNPDLNMLNEAKHVRHAHPSLPDPVLLDLITGAPARALGYAASAGRIQVGHIANFVVVTLPDVTAATPFELLWHPESRVSGVVRRGAYHSVEP